jgi:hypothetical protein
MASSEAGGLDMDFKKEDLDKYLDFIDWLWNRFSVNGEVVISRGGKPSAYSKLESAYFEKHCKKI